MKMIQNPAMFSFHRPEQHYPEHCLGAIGILHGFAQQDHCALVRFS